MKMNDFIKQWFYQNKKQIIDFGYYKKEELYNIQPDAMPLILCSILNRKVINKPRRVFISNEFDESISNWDIIKNMIENGEDIHPFMSKQLKVWEKNDFLLFFSGISHIHLIKNEQGGIGDELVFGIFTHDAFYAIYLGNHKDLYNLDKFVEIIKKNNWLHLLGLLDLDDKVLNDFDRDLFKRNALKYKMNLISTAGINQHQHSNLIDFELNNVNYKNLPLPVYFAYINEIEFIIKLEQVILQCIRKGICSNRKYYLVINKNTSHYEIFQDGLINRPIKVKFPNKILCSNFMIFRENNYNKYNKKRKRRVK